MSPFPFTLSLVFYGKASMMTKKRKSPLCKTRSIIADRGVRSPE